jgi:hypothetical protein
MQVMMIHGGMECIVHSSTIEECLKHSKFFGYLGGVSNILETPLKVQRCFIDNI